MKQEYLKAHPDFLANYLYNKLAHSPKNQFNLNFTDISLDLSNYIEANYSNYISVSKVNRYDIYVPEETIFHLNALNRDYIKFYTWLKRDLLLSELNNECNKLNANYVMSEAKKEYFRSKGLADSAIDTIDNLYKEWKAIRGYRTSRDTVNFNTHTYLNNITNSNVITINGSNKQVEFHCKPDLKTKGKSQKYNSFRATNDLTATRNDLEPKSKYSWENSTTDVRQLRSEFLADYPDYVDLGDMSSNFPNLINCIRTGKYTDEDFHSKVANENGISRSVAKMAAVRCCFNATKVNILQGLLHGVNMSSITVQLEAMKDSGLFYWKKNKKSDIYELMIQDCRTVEECHNFFSRAAASFPEDTFFNYCNDMLTSWDACHNTYHNDYCPSLLAEFSSAIETSIIKEAAEKGIIIVNAYDHGYCLNGINYDWKGKYKEWAERLLPGLLEAMERDRLGIIPKEVLKKENIMSVMSLGNKNCLGKKNAAKNEVREFIRTHNYDINLAQKQFGWDKNVKKYWNSLIKQGKI